MSNFKMKAKHKTTGEIAEITCLDDYFGKHKYGYIIGDCYTVNEDTFNKWYTPLETQEQKQ